MQVGPKCNHKCPYKREVERDLRHRNGDGHVTTEAEIGGMWPRAKEHLEPPGAGGTKEGSFPRASIGSTALTAPRFQASDTDFQFLDSRTMRE